MADSTTTVSTANTTDPTAYQQTGDATTGTQNSQTNNLTNIFNQQLADQITLYAQITALNDQSNKVKSFLSEAKSVSEKVS